MTNDTMSPYTLLSQTRRTCLRAVQTPVGHILQHFSLGKLTQVELTADELQAWLQALPPAVLLAALAAQGWTADEAATTPGNPFFDLDDPRPCEESQEMRI